MWWTMAWMLRLKSRRSCIRGTMAWIVTRRTLFSIIDYDQQPARWHWSDGGDGAWQKRSVRIRQFVVPITSIKMTKFVLLFKLNFGCSLLSRLKLLYSEPSVIWIRLRGCLFILFCITNMPFCGTLIDILPRWFISKTSHCNPKSVHVQNKLQGVWNYSFSIRGRLEAIGSGIQYHYAPYLHQVRINCEINFMTRTRYLLLIR